MKHMTLKSLLALSIASTLFVSCTSKKSAQNEFKIGITQEFESLNPLVLTMMASYYTYSFVGRGLVSLDPQGKWYPQLAVQVPSIENGGAKIITVDGKKTIQAVWEIKPEAVWNDGTPVTCGDFLLARQIAESPNVSIASKETYTQVAKIEWPEDNPKKCTFTHDKLRWDFYQLAQFYPLPRHLEESVFNEHKDTPEAYEKNTNYVKNPTMAGLYNGPYQITEVKLGSHVILETNPKFYGTAPRIPRISLKLIPNTGTLEANLRSGTIDKVSSMGFVFDQALAFEKRVALEKLPYQVLFKPSLTYEHIDLNMDNPFLKDVKVRQALVYAINRDELVMALFEGKQPVAHHFIAAIDSWYSDDESVVKKYNFNREVANKLLDEAGWKTRGTDGIRTKDGKKLSLQFMTTAGNKTRETVQTFLQNQWKNIGVEVFMKNEPARVFFGDTQKKRQYGGMAMYAWISSPESVPRSTMHSTNIATEANGWSGQNVPAWRNKKVDSLIDQLEVEFNAKKRQEIAHNLIREYTNDVPVIPLYFRADIAVIPNGLKNFELTGHQYAESNFAEYWTLE